MMKLLKLIIITVSLIILTVIVRAVVFYRTETIPTKPMLDVTFEHSHHRKQPCAGCHHNFIDDASGQGGCFNCHKYNEEINLETENIFHKFCTDCHIKNAIQGNKSGPKRQCSRCHKNDGIVD